jgi:hypothetical protein
MKPKWMQRFYERHGVWPIAGGAGQEPPDPEGEEGDESEEQDKDPRIKQLSDEAAKYRVRAKEAEGRAESVETELRGARVELAVRREAVKRDKPFADLDVVMKVLDLDTIATDESGEPVEVGAALDRLGDRHPYLLAEQATPVERTDPSKLVPSGTSMNRDKNKGKGIDYKKLAAKYPALQRGRRW